MGSKLGKFINGSPSNSQQQSTASNQAFPQLSAGLTPQVDTGTGASQSIAALLGVGGDPAAQAQAFHNFQNSTGFQDQLTAGSQAITGNAASKGLLNSGSTAGALQKMGQTLSNQSYASYLNPLQSLVGSGNQAAGIVGNAGQQSQSTGESTGAKKGAGGILGAGLSLGASYL